jgi:hypothetical protein
VTHPELAADARRELALREKQPDWPSADITAWRAIAELLEHGSVETPLTWSDLVATLTTAEARRIEAVIAARGTPREAALEQRLGAVAAIRRTIERSAWRHFVCLPAIAA